MTKRLAAIPAAAVLALTASAQQTQAPPRQPPQQTVPLSARDTVVITGMVPVPDVGEGAPLFTAPEVKEIEEKARTTAVDSRHDLANCGIRRGDPPMICEPYKGVQGLLACEIEYATKAANLAGKAADATAAAEASRRDAAAGKVDMKIVEAAELTRQHAVTDMEKARQKLLETQAMVADLQDIVMTRRIDATTRLNSDLMSELKIKEMNRARAGWGLGVAQPDQPEGVTLTDIRALRGEDGKGAFARIDGVIRNAGEKAVDIPPLSATLVDARGLPLATSSVEADHKGRIAPGATYPFAFEVRPAPAETRNAVVSVASKYAPPPRVHVNGLVCPPSGKPPGMLR